MSKNKAVALIVMLVLIASNGFFLWALVQSRQETETLRSELAAAQARTPVIEFNRLFVDEVLGAENQVSFETRLELENRVRALGDQEILDRWNKFVNAREEQEAQAGVKSLLGLLAERMAG